MNVAATTVPAFASTVATYSSPSKPAPALTSIDVLNLLLRELQAEDPTDSTNFINQLCPERLSRQQAAENGSHVEDLVELIDALIDVIVEENIALSIGLPASQSRHTGRKLVLAEQFEKSVADVSMRRVVLHPPDRTLQARMLQRIELLRISMDENMARLRAAIKANQHRIDAVTAAIREQISDNSPYNATGRIGGHSASSRTSLRA
jgi:hypothetical protein